MFPVHPTSVAACSSLLFLRLLLLMFIRQDIWSHLNIPLCCSSTPHLILLYHAYLRLSAAISATSSSSTYFSNGGSTRKDDNNRSLFSYHPLLNSIHPSNHTPYTFNNTIIKYWFCDNNYCDHHRHHIHTAGCYIWRWNRFSIK